MEEEEDVEWNGKRAKLVMVVSEGAIEMQVERSLRADSEIDLSEKINRAAKTFLESIPVEEVKRTSAKIGEDDENLREPHPVVVALVSENRKLVKELDKMNGSMKSLCERLGADT